METPPPIPPASFGPPPRRVKFLADSPSSNWALILLFLPFYILAFVLTGHVLLSLLTPVLGTPIPGTTLSTRIEIGGEDGHDTYKLYYTYQRNGQKIQTWDKLQKSDFDQIHHRPHPQPITVYYLSLGPLTRSNPNSFSSQLDRIFCLLIITIIWDTLFFAIPYFALKGHLHDKRIFQYGAITTGVIVAKRQTGNSDSTQSYITYTYTHPFTSQPHAIEYLLSEELYNTVEINQPVTVFYDPVKPENSVLYEFSDYKIL